MDKEAVKTDELKLEDQVQILVCLGTGGQAAAETRLYINLKRKCKNITLTR